MSPQAKLPDDHPMMQAWLSYQRSESYANSAKWAAEGKEFINGSLFAAFIVGFQYATERAGNLHESINPASDVERLNGDPGAGAMGAVIEYRDTIREGKGFLVTPPSEARAST